jgi:DNA-binding PadR family transcriptional regulator
METVSMRVGFSILNEIKDKRAALSGQVYGIKDIEFERMIKLLEKQGYIERVLRVGDRFSLKPARLSEKGERFLMEHAELADEYPDSMEELKEWVRADRAKE